MLALSDLRIKFILPFSGGTTILPKSIQENELINKLTRPYHEVCDIENEGGKMTWLRLVPNKKGRWNDPMTNVNIMCHNDELSWLFTNRLSATR